MKVTKLGHSCLLIEEGAARIITDPGVFTEGFEEVSNISAVLISHEHADHINIPFVKGIVLKNSEVKIFSNESVCKILTEEGIPCSVSGSGESIKIADVLVEGFGEVHAEIHPEIPLVKNIGFLVAEKLYFPGDVFLAPKKPVSVLALPIAAPWAKISEVVEFARSVAPKKCFPIHDAILLRPEPFYRTAEKLLREKGVEFLVPEVGESFEV
ncbi:MAG: hypothetical protein COU07_01180 [Candidatus Harrisonbacteria bacterium CG10_big_fil_rev_8_21_14_0_10_40_38]|uniref:Metallo-beta-lactamase domain-containing protein n=1 Tax=Candidatus Harrisonbacteria bacterium CG10_big_fil_rev_8_21_14_0_10_40_38 TaxID=1974583 RepID=A0A2H0UV10_9BACT|nr:MAG: hypothetical protein COU07_01180 [Candidatus Harrisonbacteria bacterium CG10_big_fil_rev_8_21_14_0_10_40_38]